MRTFVNGVLAAALSAGLWAQTPPPARISGAGTSRETKHLTVTIGASDAAVAPGARFSLILDVTPKPKMHVYAPGQTTYIPVALTLDANDAVKPHTPVFPTAETYFFKPLNETQRVFSRPFRVVQDLTVALTPGVRARARQTGATLEINGTLTYQACDDEVCYLPARVPVSWTIPLRARR